MSSGVGLTMETRIVLGMLLVYCSVLTAAPSTSDNMLHFPASSRQAARSARICETSLLSVVGVVQRDCEWVSYTTLIACIDLLFVS